MYLALDVWNPYHAVATSSSLYPETALYGGEGGGKNLFFLFKNNYLLSKRRNLPNVFIFS